MDRMLFQNGHHNICWNKVRVAAPCCHRKPAEIYFGCDGWGDLEAGVGRTKKLLSVVRFQACAGIKLKPNNDTVLEFVCCGGELPPPVLEHQGYRRIGRWVVQHTAHIIKGGEHDLKVFEVVGFDGDTGSSACSSADICSKWWTMK
jgi:hypothetical protein